MVVETIDFFREEESELPPPMALKEVVALNKAAPYEADEEDAEDAAQPNGRPHDMQVRPSDSVPARSVLHSCDFARYEMSGSGTAPS